MTRKLAAIALSVGAMLLAAGSGADAAEESITIATEGAYPPFNAIDASGNLVGFDLDIGKALCQKMKVECTFIAQDWSGIIPGLVAGKYDVILASMGITEERKKKVAFTDPYYKSALTFVGRKESQFDSFSNDALSGKVIGAQAGTTQAEFVSNMLPAADLRLYPSQDEVNLDLASGRLDLQVSDLLPMLEWTEKTEDGKCCTLMGEIITDPRFAGDGIGMAVRLEDNDLRQRLNAALKEIRSDGTYKAINDKYFTIDVFTLK